MANKVIRLTEQQLIRKIKKAICESVAYKLDYPWPDPQENLVEMARINVRDSGNIFPHNSWEVKIWSNDHTPPHFHVIKDGWNVSFLISDGTLYEIKSRGSKQDVYNYMCSHIKEWLQSPCAILPQVTNQQNAEAQWEQIHG